MRQHHALGEQAVEGFAHGNDAFAVHQFGEEAGVQQVQDGVFDAADVLVGRLPVGGGGGFDHLAIVLRRHIAELVPARFHKGVHGIGFALGMAAAFGAGGFVELGHFSQRRAAAVGDNVLGQDDGQLLGGYRDVAAGVAVDNRNRAAPVALAGNAPVAQAVLGFGFAGAECVQFGADGVEGSLKVQAVEFAAVDQAGAFFGAVPFVPVFRVVGLRFVQFDYLLDGQAEFVGELEIALVVGGHGHHRAVAVAPQYIVCHPHFQALAV